MNIFEYLGLDENHRKLSNKVTQLVKHWDEVPASRKDGKDFVAQVKKDGVCSLAVIFDGKVAIFSRTGKRFTSMEFVENNVANLGLPEGVYFGEVWARKDVASLEVVSGIVNPNRVHPLSGEQQDVANQLRFSMFDRVGITEFIDGKSSKPFWCRFDSLDGVFRPRIAHFVDLLYPYFVQNEAAVENFLEAMISRGEEGIVIRDNDSDWLAGHKGWRAMKKVRGVDYDLECMGYEEGTGKYEDKVANLIFKWKGDETIKCMLGKGWTHKMAGDMFCDIAMRNNTLSPIGKIFQVYALEESSKGKLRLPKVGELRHDKEASDV